MVKRILDSLASLRLTLVIILLLAVILLLGLWVPQKGLIGRSLYLQWQRDSPGLVSALDLLGITRIHTSPAALALWGLFFINLALVMGRRFRAVIRKTTLPVDWLRGTAPAPACPHVDRIPLSPAGQAGAPDEAFSGSGYRFYGTMERFYAVRNRWSPLATLVFHLSFFLILLGIVVTLYTRFKASVDIAEGEQFTGALEQYNPPVMMPKLGEPPGMRFTVESIAPRYEANTPVGITIVLREENGAVREVEINRPYKTGNISLVIQNIGVAPLVILRDRQGKELDGAFVKLNVLKGKEDTFVIGGLSFATRFFPDYMVEDNIERTRSEKTNDPAFRFTVWKNRTYLAGATVRPGGVAEVAEYRVSVPEYRYWVRFLVVKEQGLPILYTGFALATLALIWRLLFFRREIYGTIDPDGDNRVLVLSGRAEFYRALFEDEFHRMGKNLLGKNETS